MKNPVDYHAGFTTPLHVPGKERPLTGGAARNSRLAAIGGATGAQAQAIAAFQAYIEPVIGQMQNQLAAQQQMVQQMMNMMQKAQSNSNG